MDAHSETRSNPVEQQAAPGTRVPGAPARADGVQVLGNLQGSGYRRPPSLVRRGDGQVLQLTPLLYQVLEQIDGKRGLEEIADAVSTASGRLVSAANIDDLINGHLLPLGLLRLADGSDPELKRSNPLLQMRFRASVTDPERTRNVTKPFAGLFHPVVVVPVLLAFAIISWWVLAVEGLASATHEAFTNPGLLLLVLVITLVSAGFHEFGHAAAATRGGATPGTMGVGLYLVWPAFYTDVTDSYRLGKAGRIRTDAGGLYFNAIVIVAIAGIWLATRYDALLLVVATQLVMMVRQLTPIVRFDGYHILADLVGVPDLFQRIKPTLAGMLPWNWGNPESRELKPWARVVITLWVLIVVPLLVIALVAMVLALPRILGTAWRSISEQALAIQSHWGTSAFGDASLAALGIVAVGIPVAGLLYLLIRLVRQVVQRARRSTEGSPLARTIAVITGAAIVAGLAFAWWPSADTYRPVEAYEGGTLMDAVSAISPAPAGLREGARSEAMALWDGARDLPTRDAPELSMVLVPSEDPTAPTWVFPFDRPAAPTGDDAQALAVNTKDGSIAYDVVFALVWADDSGVVDTTNEAYAFASCTGCAAVAIGFQVVLIVGQADVIVPQNLSAAVNYNCIQCVTYALASQLVVTLEGPLSGASMAELSELWTEIAEYGATIPNRPLSEIQSALDRYKDRILSIISADPASGVQNGSVTPTPSPSTTPPPPTESPRPAPIDQAPTSEPTTPGEPGPAATPTPAQTPSPSGSGTPAPTSSPTPTEGAP